MAHAYTSHQFLARCLGRRGDPYVFGRENPLDPDYRGGADCSELTQWSDNTLGGHLPDGAQNQYLHARSHGTLISVEEAIHTPAALLFMGRYTGGSRSVHHVAPSQGNGETIEARGRAWGINVFSAFGRPWSYGALLPDCNYAAVPATIPGDGGSLYTAPVILREGSKGEAVKWEQAFLNIVNEAWPLGDRRPLKVDSVYGPRTVARVREFETFANTMRQFLWEKAGHPGRAPGLLQVDGITTGPTEDELGIWVKHALAKS